MKRIVFVSIAVLVSAGMAWTQGKEPVSNSHQPESINTVWKVTSESSSTTGYKETVNRLISPDRDPEISYRLNGDGPALVVYEPNPAGRVTGIAYTLSASGPASLAIYNTHGRKVKTLFAGQGKAGKYRLEWDGKSEQGGVIPTGDYFCRLAAGGSVEVRRIVLSK